MTLSIPAECPGQAQHPRCSLQSSQGRHSTWDPPFRVPWQAQHPRSCRHSTPDPACRVQDRAQLKLCITPSTHQCTLLSEPAQGVPGSVPSSRFYLQALLHFLSGFLNSVLAVCSTSWNGTQNPSLLNAFSNLEDLFTIWVSLQTAKLYGYLMLLSVAKI